MIYITDATEEDLQRIIEIEKAAISPPWTHGALLGEVFRDDSFFAVARECARRAAPKVHAVHPIVGFVILRQVTDEGELFQIAVDEAARRRGVADTLMEAALGYASAKALIAVYLEVRISNEAAIHLYKKYGFVSARHRKNYFDSPVEDAVVMVRQRGV